MITLEKETIGFKRVVEVGQEGVIDNCIESVHINQTGKKFFSVWIHTNGVECHITENDITIWKAKSIDIGNKGVNGKINIPNKVKRF
jgi:hypothetical protein